MTYHFSEDVKELNPIILKEGYPSNGSKYHNKRTEYAGVVYDSQKEAVLAAGLDAMKQSGEIDFWLRQVQFPLPGNIIYRADFVTFSHRGIACLVNVYEVKGVWTAEAKIKLKLFKVTYPNLPIEVI